MKLTQTPSAAVRTQRKTARSARRPGAAKAQSSNHTVNTELERQADEAAERVLRGEEGVAHHLTPAAPSGISAPGSPGEPLSGRLRADLEPRLGADLGAVRLHRGASAGAVARSQGAKAFAAGPDLFFAPGAYDPSSSGGRRLLVHELAHVLQQTARPAAPSVAAAPSGQGVAPPALTAASDRRGGGPIQRTEPDDYDLYFPNEAAPDPTLAPAIEQLIDDQPQHADASKEGVRAAVKKKEFLKNAALMDPKNAAFTRLLVAQLVQTGKDTAVLDGDALRLINLVEKHKTILDLAKSDDGKALAEELKTKQVSAWRSLLVDFVKLLGLIHEPLRETYFTAVLSMLDRDKEFLLRSWIKKQDMPFITWLQSKRDSAWFVAAAEHVDLKGFWPAGALGTFRALLFNPMLDKPAELGRMHDVKGEQKYESWESRDKFLTELVNKGRVIFSARVLIAMTRIREMNRDRTKLQQDWIDGAVKKQGTDRIGQRVDIASQVAAWAGGTGPEVWALPKDKLRALANDAATVWRNALTAQKTFLGGGQPPRHEQVTGAFGERVAAAMIATQVFARGKDDKLPLPKTYGEKVTIFANQLISLGGPGYSGDLLTSLLGRFMYASGKDLFTPKAAAAQWLTVWLVDFLETARDYKSTDDVDEFDDKRAVHRLRMAEKLHTIAERFGWSYILDVTTKIIHGEGKSRLYIASNWVESTSQQEPNAMLVDFSPNQILKDEYRPEQGDKPGEEQKPVQRLLGITVGQLVLSTEISIIGELLAKIGQATQDIIDNKLAAKDITPTLDKVLRVKPSELTTPRPRLWTAPDFMPALTEDFTKLSGEVQHVELLKLIASNPKTRDQLRPPKGQSFFLTRKMKQPRAWLIPDLIPVVQTMRHVEAINLIVAAEAKIDIKEVPGLEDGEWWKHLVNAIAKAKQEGDETYYEDEINAPFLELLQGEMPDGWNAERLHRSGGVWATMQKAMRAALRRMMTEIRKQTVAEAKTHLDPLADMSQIGDRAEPMSLAEDVIRKFTVEIVPAEDRDAQIAALMLDLGETLSKAYPTPNKAKMVPIKSWHRFVEIAMAHAKADPVTQEGASLSGAFARVVPEEAERTRLLANRQSLATFDKNMLASVGELQEHFGIVAEGGTIRTPLYATTLKPNEPFEQGGITYKITKIHRDFVFNPEQPPLPSVLREPTEERKEIPRTGQPLLTIEISDPDNLLPGKARFERLRQEKQKEHPDKPIEFTTEEVEVENANQTFYVLDNQEDMLEHLSNVFDSEIRRVVFERLETVMTVFGETMVVAAEMYMPGGQAAFVAQIMMAVDQVFSDKALMAIKEYLDNPGKLVDDLSSKLLDLFTPEGIFEFLFLTDSKFAFLDNIKGKGEGKVQETAGSGRIGRIFRFFTRIGRRFLNGFRKLKSKVRPPIARLHSSIVTRPTLLWLLQEGAQLAVMAIDKASEATELVASVKERATEFRERIASFLVALDEMELPDEIIEPNALVAAVLDLALGKVPMARLLRPLLDKTHAIDKIAAYAREGLDKLGLGGWVDAPNDVYRKRIRPVVEPEFLKMKGEFVDGVYDLSAKATETLNSIDERVHFDNPLPRPTMSEEGGKPTWKKSGEMEMFDSPTMQPTGGPAEVPGAGGDPLPSAHRGAAESGFGHDFGHVRLHSDSPAARLTSSLGADAVTSGSHIYLRSGLDTSAGHGAHVVDHELAHVVQQTGPRPLGESHSASPNPGRPGMGLRADPGREAAADRAATDLSRGRTPDLGAPAGGDPIGMQPSLKEFAKNVLPRIVGEMGKLPPKGEFTAPVAPDFVPGNAIPIWEGVHDILSKPDEKQIKPESYLAKPNLVKAIGAHVSGSISKGDVGIKGVASLAPKNTKKEPLEGPFVTLLEGYIFARTGVAMQIHWGMSGSGPKVDRLEIGYIHLPDVPFDVTETKAIWDEVMESFSGTPDEKKKLREVVKFRLSEHKTPRIRFFERGNKFRFRQKFVDEIGNLVKMAEPDQYIKVDLEDNNFGLRVSTHGELKKRQKDTAKKGPDRESHHIPQYLLVEYFRNKNDRRAWPELDSGTAGKFGLPGAIGESTVVDKVGSGSDSINLKAVDSTSERGAGIPAVLLAAQTHRAPVHIEGSADEDGSHGQSVTVHDHFREQLPAALQVKKEKETVAWTNYAADTAASPTPVAAVLKAMRETYSWMYQKMKDKLAEQLPSNESDYFTRLATAAGKPAAKLDTAGAMKSIESKLQEKQDTHMKDFK